MAGLFLTLIGASLVLAVLLSGAALVSYAVFFSGAALAVVSLAFSRTVSFGKPAPAQVAALGAAIALEVALFIPMGHLLPRGTPEAVRWMWVLMIVGAHFLPMAISFGPRLLVLGLLCLANAATGRIFKHAPAELFLLLDGVMKVGFGIWLLRDKPAPHEESLQRA